MCDVEVKAPIPCYTSIALTVNYDVAKTAPTVADVQNAVASGINALEFPGSISASLVDQLVHNAISNVVNVTAVMLTGSIRNIDGTLTPLVSPSVIAIPSVPANMLSGRTSAFFVQPTNVTVTLVPVVVPVV
jgi:2-keto-4-pentenoate hydratase